MIDPLELVAAAREARGTPFHHEGRIVGVGLDCIGLLAHAADRNGIPYIDGIPYSTMPTGAKLIAGLAMNLVRVLRMDRRAGDVLCFWIRHPFAKDEPRHVALQSTQDRMIHTFSRAGANGDQGKVVEQEITAFWLERLDSVWRYPELA